MHSFDLVLHLYMMWLWAGGMSPSSVVLSAGSSAPRELTVTVPVSAEVLKTIEQAAATLNMSVKEYLRECIGFGYIGLGMILDTVSFEERKIDESLIEQKKVVLH